MLAADRRARSLASHSHLDAVSQLLRQKRTHLGWDLVVLHQAMQANLGNRGSRMSIAGQLACGGWITLAMHHAVIIHLTTAAWPAAEA
eukprot:72543-Pleurochrysis_carterae.AAC.1